MPTLSVLTWIGNAFAVLLGKHGAVTDQALQAGCSRQAAYDQAAKVQQAVADAQHPGPTRDQLLDEIATLRQEVQRLRAAATTLVAFGPDQQRRWAVLLHAAGVSLRLLAGLFEGLLGAAAPNHAT